MKKTFLIIPFLLLILAVPAHALFNSDVKKAKEFMQVDMYPEAVELLKKLIYEKPTDAEVHYLLGTCYLHQGYYYWADESFGRAVKLKPAYKQDIGEQFSKAGDDAINSYDSEIAISLYEKAIQYNPELKNNIVQTAFEIGESYFKSGQYNLAYSSFMVSAEFSSSHNEKIGQKLMAMAKAKGTSKADSAFYKKEAERYLRKAEAFPPDIIAKKGDKPTFILKAGEYSPFIKAPYGSGFKFQKQYGDVEICWQDGKCFAPDKLPDNKEGDFRFHCITDCDVRVVFF